MVVWYGLLVWRCAGGTAVVWWYGMVVWWYGGAALVLWYSGAVRWYIPVWNGLLVWWCMAVSGTVGACFTHIPLAAILQNG